MHQHNKPRTSARQLPAVNPVQLPLPGIPPLPKARYLLPVPVRETISRHRYPLIAAIAISTLYASGQGDIATGLLFAIGLHQVNQFIDHRMTGGDQ